MRKIFVNFNHALFCAYSLMNVSHNYMHCLKHCCVIRSGVHVYLLLLSSTGLYCLSSIVVTYWYGLLTTPIFLGKTVNSFTIDMTQEH